MPAILWIALALAAPEAEPPPSASSKPEIVTNPDWIRRPDGADIARYYPPSAEAKNLSGLAVLTCQVKGDGSLGACAANEESPPGEGFGEAALRLSPLFKMRPTTKDGQPVGGGTVPIPIRFVLYGGAIDPMSLVIGCYGAMGARSERVPTDDAAVKAYGFFGAQVALISAQLKTPPAEFEAALTSARTSELTGRSPASPSLASCRSIYEKATPQSAKPPPQ